MAIITISKEEVIKALRTEPLKAGYWIDDDHDKTETCPVCAVGAVLRHKGFKNEEIEDTARYTVKEPEVYHLEEEEDADGIVMELLEEGCYLSALSSKFEQLATDYDEPLPELIKFVEEHFPAEFSFDSAQRNSI